MESIPYIPTKNESPQMDGFQCGTHVCMYIMIFEKHFDLSSIDIGMIEKDPSLQVITNHHAFRYDARKDADQMRAELKTIFLQLAKIVSKLPHRHKFEKVWKTMVDEYGQDS